MKKLLILLAFMLAIPTIWAQSQKVYCEIVGTSNITQTKVKITIDFGQKKSFWSKGINDKLVDEQGKDITFNSMVDAMNFMGSIGWSFEQAYTVSIGNQNVYHFLLSKVIDVDNKINDGFKTKQDYKDANQTDSENNN